MSSTHLQVTLLLSPDHIEEVDFFELLDLFSFGDVEKVSKCHSRIFTSHRKSNLLLSLLLHVFLLEFGVSEVDVLLYFEVQAEFIGGLQDLGGINRIMPPGGGDVREFDFVSLAPFGCQLLRRCFELFSLHFIHD